MIKLLNLGALWFAERLDDTRGVRNGASDDVANQFVRRVRFERGAAIGGKLLQVEHLHLYGF